MTANGLTIPIAVEIRRQSKPLRNRGRGTVFPVAARGRSYKRAAPSGEAAAPSNQKLRWKLRFQVIGSPGCMMTVPWLSWTS